MEVMNWIISGVITLFLLGAVVIILDEYYSNEACRDIGFEGQGMNAGLIKTCEDSDGNLYYVKFEGFFDMKAKLITVGDEDFSMLYDFSNGTNNDDTLRVIFRDTNKFYEVIKSGGTATLSYNETPVFDFGTNASHVFAYKENDVSIERTTSGGTKGYTDTSVTIPTVIDEFSIGHRNDNSGSVGSFIMKRFHYYASRLKDDFLKRLR